MALLMALVVMIHYKIRGTKMKRAPKREFCYPGSETATYAWGQENTMKPGEKDYAGLEMPPWMIRIADGNRLEFGETPNQSIIFADGVKQHAPPHKDKIPDNTSFYLFSFGTPRNFQFLETDEVETEKRDRDDDDDDDDGMPALEPFDEL